MTTISLSPRFNARIRPYGDQFAWEVVGTHPATVYALAFGLAGTEPEAEQRARAAWQSKGHGR